jgi:hypothetical protein
VVSPVTAASRTGSGLTVRQVPDARKGGAIIVFDYEGAAIKRYNAHQRGLKTLGRGTRKAGDTNILTEKLILTHEGCEACEA